ncbi:metallophosphoesterase [Roseibacterium sp. SDUM158016]|jgi:serine/threonine protein phosphatase 1|uniref:metallophosphoesterase n=1 Tax=Roseicyclus sediminis TaxID=2980997 RepID=UPI0021CF0B3D|nr:metallophosphoesterase [Roseibacterium sp. SDUM158016]MCU4653030.1 metallophosphoesterase [Roseibacterium sp. SDUM158016]
MLRSVRSLLGRRERPRDVPDTEGARELDAPRPERPTYVVGDLHGRADLLELLLGLIDAHIGGSGSGDPQLVFVGDYVDHGPESAETLARLRELTRDYPDNVVCLMGNHERMLLDFLADPATRGPRWMREGGAATLLSFRIDPDPILSGGGAEEFREAAARLRKAMPEGLAGWMANLPLSFRSGNLWVVHAGADPAHPMDQQSSRVLLWGHPEFEAVPRADGTWVAHGHVEMQGPVCEDGRIALDTGAWRTGRLTACALRPDGRHDFLQT